MQSVVRSISVHFFKYLDRTTKLFHYLLIKYMKFENSSLVEMIEFSLMLFFKKNKRVSSIYQGYF